MRATPHGGPFCIGSKAKRRERRFCGFGLEHSSMASKRDYYEVLGVSRESAPEDIKKSYKKLALANHPDRNPGDESAVDRFKEAAEAFEVLSNPDKRSRYDRFGHKGVSGSNGRSGFNDVSDIFDMFGDLFEGFGGGRSSRRRGRRGSRGEHLQSSLTIGLIEAAKGCTRDIELQRREVCGTCSGSGAKAGSSPIQCDYCGGHGQVVQSQGFFRIQTTCPACRGAGTVVRDKCEDCGGAGRTAKSVKLEVKVPAGVDNGMQLCLRGEGESGLQGGGRGDLYVNIIVEEHPLFKRDGDNLICQVPITYTQAVLGTELEIPVLEGRHQHTIPAGTQAGEVFRIRGGGMPDPHTGRTGDLLVQMHLEVPKKVTETQEELLRQLAEMEHTDVSPHRTSFLEKLKDWFGRDDEDDEKEN